MARKKNKEEWKVFGNVFDDFTNRIIHKLEAQGYFSELVSAYRLGKEANVFLADTKDDSQIIIKIYRLETCNFNKMYSYLIQDDRFQDLKGQRRKIIFSWVQREYRNLLKAREVIRVPTPLAVKDNVLLLEMIGVDEPAQQLKDLIPVDLENFFNQVISNMKKLYSIGLVHGDLSSFNILNDAGEPVFIDFSQSTTTKSPGWRDLLERDVKNVCAFFKKHGLDVSIDDSLKEILG